MSCVVWCVVSPQTRVLCALSVCVLQCNHSQTVNSSRQFSNVQSRLCITDGQHARGLLDTAGESEICRQFSSRPDQTQPAAATWRPPVHDWPNFRYGVLHFRLLIQSQRCRPSLHRIASWTTSAYTGSFGGHISALAENGTGLVCTSGEVDVSGCTRLTIYAVRYR